MSDAQNPPAGWTWSHFKAVCADVGSWTWGTVQGAFNEKASLTQIIVDAFVGMIPLVGDATAVRDLIAIIIGMIDGEEKRNSKWQWILLIVLLFALIPVIGGVVKGVGRILCKVFEEAARMSKLARAAHIAQGAKDIIAFLNRVGVKNAEKWLLSLKFAVYESDIMAKFVGVMDTFANALLRIKKNIGSHLPQILIDRIDGLFNGIRLLKAKGTEMIPAGIHELDQSLREIQTYIRSGGETTSRAVAHEMSTGERAVTRPQEARLVEDEFAHLRSDRGGLKQNAASRDAPEEWRKYYDPPEADSGYLSLLERVNEDGTYPYLAAYSGKVVNRELCKGEKIFRFFGPPGVTRGHDVGKAWTTGKWWGIGEAPKTAKEWREQAAVLDEFNRDGFLVEGVVVGDKGPKAAVGHVSEQASSEIPGQYLPGGAVQGYFDLPASTKKALTDRADAIMAEADSLEKTVSPVYFDEATGITFTIRPTGWKDANGKWGYLDPPGTLPAHVVDLTHNETAPKK